MLHALYRGLTDIGGPAIRFCLNRRRAAGKEDPRRQPERLGVASRPRPDGRLVWFHAASVGEAQSILALVERLLDAHPGLHALVTTGTVTSARLMAERLPARAVHQYVPVDRAAWVRRFLDHWRPDLVLWTESDLWPNLLAEIARRGIPAALLNARMSERSFRRWRRVPGFVRPLLATFRLCLAQTEAEAERFQALGARDVRCVGNLKFSAAPLPADPAELAEVGAAIAGRPAWMLASSHPGEEEVAAKVHAILARILPDLLTVIAPRHPGRGAEVAVLVESQGLRVVRRSEGALPAGRDAVYVADTMGEMGLFYRLVPVACVGGSLVPHGGHNPIEPAQLGCAVLYGPHMHNFAEVAAELEAAGAARPVHGAVELAGRVGRLLQDPEERRRLSELAAGVAERNRRTLDRFHEALRPLLHESGVGATP